MSSLPIFYHLFPTVYRAPQPWEEPGSSKLSLSGTPAVEENASVPNQSERKAEDASEDESRRKRSEERKEDKRERREKRHSREDRKHEKREKRHSRDSDDRKRHKKDKKRRHDSD